MHKLRYIKTEWPREATAGGLSVYLYFGHCRDAPEIQQHFALELFRGKVHPLGVNGGSRVRGESLFTPITEGNLAFGAFELDGIGKAAPA